MKGIKATSRTNAAWMAVFVVASCGGDQDTSTATAGPVTIRVDQVEPLAMSDAIAEVVDLEVLPDGAVWVLNSVEPLFVGFDQQGGSIRTYGSEGGGPDEFLFASAFVTGGIDGKAWVFDLRRHAFIAVTGDPAVASNLRIPQEQVPPGSVVGGRSMLSPSVRTAPWNSEIIIPRTNTTLQDGLVAFRQGIIGADLMALDVESGSVREVVKLSEVLSDPTEGFALSEGGFPLWYRLWAVCNGGLRVYDRVENTIRSFGLDGVEGNATLLPPVPFTHVTPRQFASAVFRLRAAEVLGAVGPTMDRADSTRLMNEMMGDVQGNGEELAQYLPRYVDFRCSPDGTLWIQPIDLDLGNLKGGPLWLRISRDGLVQEVSLPPRFDAFRFTDNRVWGVQRDEFDVATVASIQLGASLTTP